ncbi:hypothetical protein Taro_053083 [Colocasia esculenta]|uniref:Uncharacterized protein n=1 Tax=Colocasia esculenta TaxID=4460 RepID=A0A843XK96_COLES|nr:hypothetical protein [Colocasia esculenta]
MVCSCKAWSRRCRPRRRHMWHYRLSCRLRLRFQLQFPKSMALVVRPSWRGSRGWLHPLLRGRERADVWWASVLRTRYEDGAIEVT